MCTYPLDCNAMPEINKPRTQFHNPYTRVAMFGMALASLVANGRSTTYAGNGRGYVVSQESRYSLRKRHHWPVRRALGRCMTYQENKRLLRGKDDMRLYGYGRSGPGGLYCVRRSWKVENHPLPYQEKNIERCGLHSRVACTRPVDAGFPPRPERA
ncbi:hypothetical protein LX36DRAFT_441986 [Colletotrichum falcatum]|nr:hypothetical protein LX36DRAFT_441986 [Colletotrichum falcatum]